MKRGEWALFHREVIPSPEGRPYINRIRLVMTPWVSLYLHHIYENDGDRARHDHPFTFVSFILRGGYVESIGYADRSGSGLFPVFKLANRKRWSIHKHPLHLSHRIEEVDPKTVTLVLTGRRRGNDWGFYTKEGFVPWQEYAR